MSGTLNWIDKHSLKLFWGLMLIYFFIQLFSMGILTNRFSNPDERNGNNTTYRFNYGEQNIVKIYIVTSIIMICLFVVGLVLNQNVIAINGFGYFKQLLRNFSINDKITMIGVVVLTFIFLIMMKSQIDLDSIRDTRKEKVVSYELKELTLSQEDDNLAKAAVYSYWFFLFIIIIRYVYLNPNFIRNFR